MEKFTKALDTWNSLSAEGLFGAIFKTLKTVFNLVKDFVDLYKAVK